MGGVIFIICIGNVSVSVGKLSSGWFIRYKFCLKLFWGRR